MLQVAGGSAFAVPKFGIGSKICAGSEKRTEAMSDTPMNLPPQPSA